SHLSLVVAGLALFAWGFVPGQILQTQANTAPSSWQLIAADAPMSTGADGADLNLRRTYGLDQSLTTIHALKAAAAAAPAGNSSVVPPGIAAPPGSPRYPVVLSPAEKQELDYRITTLEPAER